MNSQKFGTKQYINILNIIGTDAKKENPSGTP